MSNRPPYSETELEYGRERTAAERLAALPPFLRFTPEQIEKARADNARAVAESNSPFVQLAPAEKMRVRAIREEQDWRRTLAQLDFEVAAGDDSADTAGRRLVAAQTLAENLAAQGRFDEAARVTPSAEAAHEYVDLHEAVMRDDDEWCGEECDRSFENDPSRLTREDIVAEVYSIKHGKVLPVNRCAYCLGLNVRPASAQNVALRKHRARARALTEGMKSAAAAEVLRREKLAAGEVFKQ